MSTAPMNPPYATMFQHPGPNQAYTCDAPSPFPPSFDGQPGAYAFGLFGDILAACLALAVLADYLLEARRRKEVKRLVKVQNAKTRKADPSKAGILMAEEQPAPHRSAIFAYRAFIIGLLTFVIMRAAPDALWMLAWGEVSESHIRKILWADLLMDGFALIPLFVAVVYWAWSKQVIPQLLTEAKGHTQMKPLTVSIVARNARIVGLIFVLAIGVTIGKATGG